MPPRNELPEGTDHIINGAMETNGGDTGGRSGAGGDFPGVGSLGGGTGSAMSGSAGSGLSSGSDLGGDLGGGLSSGGDLSSGGGGAGSGFIGGGSGGSSLETTGSDIGTGDGTGGTMVQQLKSEAANLRGQAGSRVRDFAESGKAKASDALDELSRVVDDAAGQIDERLGADYGGYARRASGAVSDLAETLRNKDVDELYDGARDVVRKSPGIAIATAAVLGFALVRLVKAGMPDKSATGGADGEGYDDGSRSASRGLDGNRSS